MSSLGKPDRQLWYELYKPELREHMPAHARIKFLYGHMLEALLLLLAKTAGHSVTDEQKILDLDGVVGHQDAVIDGVVIDVKSASQFGFRKFRENDLTSETDAFGYLHQIAAYSQANKNDKVGFLAIDKQSGALALCRPHKSDIPNARERIKHLRKVLKDKNKPPPRCYDEEPDGTSGNMKLSVGCSYCAYKVDCWSDANDGQGLRKFIYSKGPRWLTKVVIEPNVSEDIP
tara:strand:- start:1311 stop:2003 length:693 start_codon:yes stop_codon:yes gene_type:complete